MYIITALLTRLLHGSYTVVIPYSGEIFAGANFHGKACRLFRRNFRGFYFRGCGTLWPHPYQLMATPHMRNGTERRSEEASLCNDDLIFLLCGGFEIMKVSRLPPQVRNRHVGFSTADLKFNNCGTSHGLVRILYSSRLILLYSNHLEGRQTVENHLVHIGTNSYRRTHVMTSSISS